MGLFAYATIMVPISNMAPSRECNLERLNSVQDPSKVEESSRIRRVTSEKQDACNKSGGGGESIASG